MDVAVTGYLQLVDWSSRVVRPGKARASDDTPPILVRLQIDPVGWRATLEKLTRSTKHIGTYFGTSSRLNEVASQRSRRFLKKLTGRDAALSTPSAT